MLRQLQLPDDLRAQQAHDVGQDAERVAGDDLVARRGAAQDVALLEDQRLPAGLRQVGGGRQAVVAPADDHRVVALGHPRLLLRRAVRIRFGRPATRACAAGRRRAGRRPSPRRASASPRPSTRPGRGSRSGRGRRPTDARAIIFLRIGLQPVLVTRPTWRPPARSGTWARLTVGGAYGARPSGGVERLDLGPADVEPDEAACGPAGRRPRRPGRACPTKSAFARSTSRPIPIS